ncbi:MAG TPA: histidine phosphatase family protein, partial [Candidatus Micrarchaeota archaeon]|nr:histidine phosphatase family protein [Candidatus Micrarchaeota archaeon]
MGVEVVLVRHPESTFNARGLVQGQSRKAVLTPRGMEQAAVARNYFLKNFRKFDEIISSDLPRAMQMAQELKPCSKTGHIIQMSLVREAGRGAFEGTPYSNALWKSAHLAIDSSPLQASAPFGMESNISLFRRAGAFFSQMSMHDSKRILVVTHGEFLKAAISYAIGMDIAAYSQKIKPNVLVPPCSFSH